MKDFRDLEVWGKAHRLTLLTYEVTRIFPAEERYGLISQMRRSSASIPTNIAEGCGRSGHGDFHRFLLTAMGSASELEYQILLARDLGYAEIDRCDLMNERIIEVKKMLASLIQKVGIDRQQNR